LKVCVPLDPKQSCFSSEKPPLAPEWFDEFFLFAFSLYFFPTARSRPFLLRDSAALRRLSFVPPRAFGSPLPLPS